MGFFKEQPQTKIYIYYSRCTPISVIVTFATDGRLKPLYFMVKDDYNHECKVEVTGIKYTKDGNGCTSFCCAYQVGSRQRECVMTYYLQDHVWVLEK